jgi:hypothetical protein
LLVYSTLSLQQTYTIACTAIKQRREEKKYLDPHGLLKDRVRQESSSNDEKANALNNSNELKVKKMEGLQEVAKLAISELSKVARSPMRK